MAKQPLNQDRNFDDLAGRFKKNIYGGLKGEIRFTKGGDSSTVLLTIPLV